ncbi:MAG: hypothetical protein U1F83_08325 [Verrucomicrobiota bacterium]
MRQLAQPNVLKSAALAALVTSVVCYPSFVLRPIPYPTWYLESVVFAGSFVLWAFVFAWHTSFTHRPVFHHRIEPKLWAVATLAGVVVALILHRFLDPILRLRTPADYPTSVDEWLGMTTFALAFNPLFLTFAPLAWAIRLFHRLWFAAGFTVLFGVFVMLVKIRSAPSPLPPSVFVEILALRLGLGSCSIYFYLRGGAGLVWWWALLLQLRHLLSL